MRVAIIGGTRFIGRHLTERLVALGHQVLVVHRGIGEPADWVRCEHLHTTRAEFAGVADRVRAFGPDAVVDTLAMSDADARVVLPHLPDVPLVVLSSMDVYRAYELAMSGQSGVAVPFPEDAPLRHGRYPHRGADPGLDGYEIDVDSYDKLDVEPHYLERGGTVLRLGMVYGASDPQCREEFVLRRVRAGRRWIPVGTGNWLWTRIHVEDIANAILAVLNTPEARGEIFNIGETTTVTVRDWMERILAAAAHEATLVRVPDEHLPPDLGLSGAMTQHMLADSAKARHVLGWRPADPTEAIARSVRWHLANPPANAADADFSADERALASR